MRDAGMMRERCRFERRAMINPDAPRDLGRTRAAWQPLGEPVWCRARAPATLRDGEAVQGGATQSSVRIEVTLRASSFSRGLTAADRIIFTAGPRAGQIANIGIVTPSADGADITLICEIGILP